MDANELAAVLCRQFEGLRLKAYHDPIGFPTQGYGRLLSRKRWADLSQWPDIDEAVAESWLLEDLESHRQSVLRLCPVRLTAHQEAALIDFAFNCGSGNLQISTLRKVINRGDYERVPYELKKWVYAGGVKLPGLVKRRNAEVRLWTSQ